MYISNIERYTVVMCRFKISYTSDMHLYNIAVLELITLWMTFTVQGNAALDFRKSNIYRSGRFYPYTYIYIYPRVGINSTHQGLR